MIAIHWTINLVRLGTRHQCYSSLVPSRNFLKIRLGTLGKLHGPRQFFHTFAEVFARGPRLASSPGLPASFIRHARPKAGDEAIDGDYWGEPERAPHLIISGAHRAGEAGEGACNSAYLQCKRQNSTNIMADAYYMVATKYGAKRISSIDLVPRLSTRTQTVPWLVFRLTPASLLEWFHIRS